MDLWLSISTAALGFALGPVAWTAVKAVREGAGLCLAGWVLPVALTLAWSASVALGNVGATMPTFVFAGALVDLLVAGAAVVIATVSPPRIDARTVGGISMALMPLHWTMAWSKGGADWTTYAVSCNIAFVIQCLTAGGWMDGLGRRARDLVGRVRHVSRVRSGDR